MSNLPSRLGALGLLVAAGFGAGAWFCGHPDASFPTTASAQTDNPGSPNAMVAQTDSKGRHLAPYGTFYMLAYASAKTDVGVEGFEPGQEVKLVAVDRPAQKLVVSNGRAQVTVSPSQLTNDLDIAAMARQKDQNNQARIASYLQAEQEAYRKFERETAVKSAEDLERRKQAEVTEAQAQAATVQANRSAQTASTASVNNGGYGYYNSGGYGYGNPYSYFVDGGTAVPQNTNTAPGGGPGTLPTTGAATHPVNKIGTSINTGQGTQGPGSQGPRPSQVGSAGQGAGGQTAGGQAAAPAAQGAAPSQTGAAGGGRTQ